MEIDKVKNEELVEKLLTEFRENMTDEQRENIQKRIELKADARRKREIFKNFEKYKDQKLVKAIFDCDAKELAGALKEFNFNPYESNKN